MAGVNVSNSALLLRNYLNVVTETLEHSSKARNRVRQNNKWTGNYLEGRLHVRRSGAINYTDDGGTTPTAAKQTYIPYKVGRKFLTASVQLSDGIMATGASGAAVAKDAITSEVQGMMRDIYKLENFMIWRDGTGVMSTVQAVSGDELKVDDARGLWEGAEYDVYDSGLSTFRGTLTIDDVESAPDGSGYAVVNCSTGTVPSGTTGTDKLVWKDSLNKAITGFDKLVDDSDLQQVTVADYPRYASLVMDNGSTLRDLDPTLFRQMMAGLRQKSGSDKPVNGLSVCTNAWQMIELEEMYEGELRLSPSDTTSGAAISSFQSSFGRVNVDDDVDAPYNKMYFIDFNEIYRGVNKKLDWRRDGGSIFKRSDLSLKYTATAVEICDYYVEKRHVHGKIEDLNETRTTMF